KLPKEFDTYKIVDDTYCSMSFETWHTAISTITTPHHELPEILGGFTRLVSLHDPRGLLLKLEAKANKIPDAVFRESTRLALVHSFEDYCRAKNAFLDKDDVVLKDSIYGVTASAANIVAALNKTGFVSDREIFKAYRKFKKLPRTFGWIQAL